jgi:asparagine synthase (glutamine-hydrolysing)
VPAHLPEATIHRTDDGWAAFGAPEQDDRADHPANGFTVRLTRAVRSRTADVGAARLATMLGDGSTVDGDALAGLLPPFAAAHRAGPGKPVVLATDWLGFQHLYWWQGEGVAAVSTSALALAVVAEAGLDSRALGLQSLVGWQVGHGTVFGGVNKLAPGSVAVLRAGRVTVRSYADEPMTTDSTPAPLADIANEMAQILRDLHEAYLGDHPDTVLQLSGGQDSRVLLCAVPPPMRAGLRALTLDVHGGVESTIAARLSAACGLDHHVHWLDEQPPIDPKTAHRLGIEAAVALDCMASPMALAPLLLAESTLDQGHRLSGAGGETARGFYYPGQPRHATTSPRLVNRLADWRLFTNEAVGGGLFEPDFAAAARTAALDQINSCFAGYSRDWLRATDEFYLFQRAQRWAGAHGSPAAVTRFSVNPLLDRRFMQLALAPPPEEKRNAHLMGQLICRLDPQLAAIPFDSGLVPARLGRRGVATTAAVARLTARKAIHKIHQRLGGVRRPQLGAAEMACLVVAHWRAAPDSVAPLRRTGLVRTAWLDELLDGRRTTESATVAFLLNLLVASDAVNDAAYPARAVGRHLSAFR